MWITKFGKQNRTYYIRNLKQKTMNTQTEVLKHKDVTGKELLYIKISSNGNNVLINVGQKTYDKVNTLVTTSHTMPKEKSK